MPVFGIYLICKNTFVCITKDNLVGCKTDIPVGVPGNKAFIDNFKIGGSRIASVMLRPSITHFLDGLARAEEIRLTLVEIEIMEGSVLDGKTIRDTGITDISESIIVGLRRQGVPMKIRPPINTELKIGDQLVLMGQLDALNRVDEIMEIR